MADNKNLEVFNFSYVKQLIPIPYESKNTSEGTYVTYGINNGYPVFLLSLYTDSPIHASVVNTKSTYVIGDGLVYADSTQDVNVMVNADDSVKEFADKIIKDYLIFGAFAVEVIFNVFGTPIEYHHIPVHKLRLNKSKTKFWYNEDWMLYRKHIIYDRWSPSSKPDATSKVFYFDGYFPSYNNVYSSPEYNGAIKAISTDIAIRHFNLNQIKSHFSPSCILTFFQGSNISEEVKHEVKRKLTESYTGEYGDKTIVDFQTLDGKSAEVKQLSANNWSKEYIEVSKKVSDDIMIGHSVTSPALFGVKTEGQLGATQELELAYSIFKANYITVKRDEIESALNQLFKGSEIITGKIKFKDRPLFNSQLSDDLKKEVMMVDELRAEAGLPSLPNGMGQRLISDLPHVNEKVDSTTLPTEDPTKPKQLISPDVKPMNKDEDVKKKSGRKLTEEDYESISHLGLSADEFEIIGQHHHHHKFALEDDIAEYVIANDIRGLSLDELSALIKKDKDIDVSGPELRDVLSQLDEAGVINVSYDDANRVTVKPSHMPEVPNSDAVTVMYQYVKRDDVNGEDIIPTTRSFCKRLIENNRLYSRQDIQSMSAIFGYDVFKYCGGWYNDPETDESRPYCRHQWQSFSVKKRHV